MEYLLFLLCLLWSTSPTFAQVPEDKRFRTYGGPIKIEGYEFPYRAGGGSFEDCVTSTDPANEAVCKPDFFTLGQINGRKRGPYAGLKDGDVFKRWGFLRDTRPERWDCEISVSWTHIRVSLTNWLNPARCLQQMVTDKYQELLRLDSLFGLIPGLDVERGQEYKRDVLQQIHDSEKDHIRTLIEHYLSTKVSTTIVFEIGNEPNIHPAMSPETYGWYLKMYADTIRRVEAEVRLTQPVDVRIMNAGLWIFDGMPSYFIRALDQGFHIAFGELTIKVPKGIKTCRLGRSWWAIRYPCLEYESVQVSEGMDLKSSFWVNVPAYWDAVMSVVGPGVIDIANLHFYPYISTDTQMPTMPEHIASLNRIAAHVAEDVGNHSVWLTEIGNFNPFNDMDASVKVMAPMCTSLQAGEVPLAQQWYWFKAVGDDQKFNDIPDFDSLSDKEEFGMKLLFQLIILLMRPPPGIAQVVRVIKPQLAASELIAIGQLLDAYSDQPPNQGLFASDNYLTDLRQLGVVYHSFAVNSGVGSGT